MSELGSGLPAFLANAIDGSTVAISALLTAMSAAMVSSFVSKNSEISFLFDACLILCSALSSLLLNYFYFKIFLLLGYEKATQETEFSYNNCCNDETGKSYF